MNHGLYNTGYKRLVNLFVRREFKAMQHKRVSELTGSNRYIDYIVHIPTQQMNLNSTLEVLHITNLSYWEQAKRSNPQLSPVGYLARMTSLCIIDKQ